MVAFGGLVAGCAQSGSTHPRPTHSVAATPKATSSAADKLLTGAALTAAFEIPSSLSDQDLAQAFVSKSSAWYAYGSVEEVNDQINAVLAKGGDPGAAILAIVQDNSPAIADGLFESGWENNSSLQPKYTSRIEEVDHVLTDWYKTHDKSGANQEPYKLWITLDSTVPVSSVKTADGRTLTFVTIAHTNADQNLVGSTLKADTDPADGKRVQTTVVFRDEGANEKIASYTQTGL